MLRFRKKITKFQLFVQSKYFDIGSDFEFKCMGTVHILCSAIGSYLSFSILGGGV
jgi:hypothetical protein